MTKRTLSPEAKARKAAYDKEWRAKNKEHVKEYGKEYIKKYYQENREKVLSQQKEHYVENPERRKRRNTPKYDKEHSRHRRKEVLNFLGGKCEKCGIDDWRVLQIDHINGGGGKERKSGYNFAKIRKDVFEYGRNKYQVLCANCHILKHFEERHGGE